MSSSPTARPAPGTGLVIVESYRSASEAGPVLDPLASASTTAASGDEGSDEVGREGGDVGGPDNNGREIRVLGAVVIPGDEVVFYLVRGPSVLEVRQAFEARGVDTVRVVAGEWVAAGPWSPVGPGRSG